MIFLILMSLLLISVSSFASDVGDKFTHNHVTYMITKLATGSNAGELAVYGTDKSGAVEIPEQVVDTAGTNYKVTAVLNSAFRKKTDITSIKLPQTVSKIDDAAFEQCSNLTTVNIPKALATISSYTFLNCEKLKSITVDAGNTSFETDGGVLYNKGKTELRIYPAAKLGSNFTVPNSVQKISENAFCLSKNLTDINLGSVKMLETRAFRSCNKLIQITIPATVTNIKDGYMVDCEKLTTINVASGNTKYQSVDGVLGEKKSNGKSKLLQYPPAKNSGATYTIPTNFDEIARMAFRKNQLQGITIPTYVKEVGPDALQNSKNLKTLTIKEGVQTIRNGAFNGCQQLTQVTLPKSVTILGNNIFFDCIRLTKIVVDPANPNYESGNGVVYTKGKKGIYCFPAGYKPTSYTIPSSVETIMFQAFRNSQWTGNITIPSNVKKIEENAFFLAQEKLTFSKGLQEIGKGAFAEMKNQMEIRIPMSVQKIEDNAFSGMPNLTTVEIPAGSQLTLMGSEVFANNIKLITATVGDNCALGELGKYAFKDCQKLTSFHAGKNSLTSIDEGAFSGCTALNNVVFDTPSKLKTIGTRAFNGATALTALTIPNTVTDIKPSAFNGCSALATVTFQETPTIQTIGNNAFQNCGLTAITIPESVKTIEKEAFNSCHKLNKVTVPKGTTHVSAQSFIFCSTLQAIKVAEDNGKYKSIDGMLANKSGDKLLAFPPGRANAEYTRIPSLITAIDSAFYSCYTLENITIPRNVTTIGDYSFANCKKLQSISFTGTTIPDLQPNMFLNTNTKKITVYVRKKWMETPANTTQLNTMKNKFKEVIPSFITVAGYDRGTEFFPTSKIAVGVIEFPQERTSVIIDKEAKDPTTSKTYKVRSVLDYAYENTTTVKAIVFLGELISIGMDALKGSSIKELYFVGNDAPSSAAKDFNEPTHYPFNNTQKIYVKESKVDAYKAAWTGGVENNITHKIPANTLAFRATACYPFNTAYHTSGDVMPYLPLQYRMMNQLSQDKAYVRARSIDDGRVPAFLGVMLVSENETNASSYCQIDENQAQTSISGIAEYNPSKYYMMGAVEDTPLTNTSTHTLFGLAKSGIFKKISVSGNTIPYFKAYLKIPVADIPMGAKSIHFIFDDNNETTGINDIVEIGNSNDSPYYNLNGVQVNKPSKGVYIHNGKKVIIK